MSIFSRIFSRRDEHAAVRPLWHRVVAIAREPEWYAQGGVADTVPGRFDAITMVLAAVLVRMEREEALIPPSVLLTELFVEDMDGQLRESGVGDMIVGKHIGKLMGTMGGRLGAYRDALASDDAAALADAVTRNVSLRDGADPTAVAVRLRTLADTVAAMPAADLLAGNIAR